MQKYTEDKCVNQSKCMIQKFPFENIFTWDPYAGNCLCYFLKHEIKVQINHFNGNVV